MLEFFESEADYIVCLLLQTFLRMTHSTKYGFMDELPTDDSAPKCVLHKILSQPYSIPLCESCMRKRHTMLFKRSVNC